MFDPYKIREDFPILKRKINDNPLIYLDNAATSQKPVQVIDAIKTFYEKHNANVHRAVHTLSQEATELYYAAFEETARFINANGIEEIVFVKNTTEAINLVAYSLGLRSFKQGDEVVVTLMEHHSNIVPWEILSKIKGFRVKYAQINDDGTLNYENLERQVTSKTKIVCVSHMSNVTGVVNDVTRISKLAHDNNALILVDAAQSVPRMPVNVKMLDVDFLAFSGHKMLAPTGIGVLYCKREILEKMEPFLGGGGMIKEVNYVPSTETCHITWSELPWRFEAGTPNTCGGIGLGEAIKYLKNLGMENVYSYEKELADYALKRFEEVKNAKVYGPKHGLERGGIIPFNLGELSSHDVALLLDQFGIIIRSGFHCAQPLHQRLGLKGTARASFYVYNTREEIDRLIEVLKEVEKA